MNLEPKTHKDLDAWKDFGLWTHEPRLSTLDWFSVTHHSSPILAIVDEVAKWAGAFKEKDVKDE